jgi:xylulokinase
VTRHLIGIDIGTTGVKTVLIDGKGRVVSRATVAYPLSQPRPGWAEQDPARWFDAAAESSRQALSLARTSGETVRAIGLSGQMHGAVFLSAEGEPLRPAILWCDQRTAAECDEIDERVGGRERLVGLTLNRAQTGFTAPKILWVRKNEPGTWERVRKILLPKDYVRYRMTNDFHTEPSDASGTLLFDVARRRWSDDVLRALEIPRDYLPPHVESPEITHTLTPGAAAAMGLRAGTPVVGGAGDCAAGAIGTGVTRAGRLSVSIGTSGVLFAHADRPYADPEARLHTFCHAVPGAWHLMGVMLMAGGALRWFRDTFGDEERAVALRRGVDPYDVLCERAAAVEPGAEGLLFLPYLQGERTPHADPNARGAFTGIGLNHTRAHFVRAVLEGVAFGLKDSLDIFRSRGVEPSEIRATGGGARSPVWRRILADVLETRIAMPEVDEGPAFGAALLASVGAGDFTDIGLACEASVRIASVTEPDPHRFPLYRERHAAYRALYPALRGGGSVST